MSGAQPADLGLVHHQHKGRGELSIVQQDAGHCASCCGLPWLLTAGSESGEEAGAWLCLEHGSSSPTRRNENSQCPGMDAVCPCC